MMNFECNNNEVLKIEQRGSGAYKRIVKFHFGFINEVKNIETAEKTIYQWYKFNLEKGEYEINMKNSTPIIVDEIEYIPVNGKIEIPKELTQ